MKEHTKGQFLRIEPARRETIEGAGLEAAGRKTVGRGSIGRSYSK